MGVHIGATWQIWLNDYVRLLCGLFHCMAISFKFRAYTMSSSPTHKPPGHNTHSVILFSAFFTSTADPFNYLIKYFFTLLILLLLLHSTDIILSHTVAFCQWFEINGSSSSTKRNSICDRIAYVYCVVVVVVETIKSQLPPTNTHDDLPHANLWCISSWDSVDSFTSCVSASRPSSVQSCTGQYDDVVVEGTTRGPETAERDWRPAAEAGDTTHTGRLGSTWRALRVQHRHFHTSTAVLVTRSLTDWKWMNQHYLSTQPGSRLSPAVLLSRFKRPAQDSSLRALASVLVAELVSHTIK